MPLARYTRKPFLEEAMREKWWTGDGFPCGGSIIVGTSADTS